MSIIWISNKKHPTKQETRPGFYLNNPKKENYVVATFKKEFAFEENIKSVSFKYACDTSGYVCLNKILVSNTNNKGPHDFYQGTEAINTYNWTNIDYKFAEQTKSVEIKAVIQLSSTNLYDFSSGFGGFILKGIITLENGKSIEIETDSSWDARLEDRYYAPHCYDETISLLSFEKAEVKKYKWNFLEANIKPCIEKEIAFENEFVIPKGEKKEFIINFPLIYSAYYEIESKGNGIVKGELDSFEIYDKKNKSYVAVGHDIFTLMSNSSLRLFDLHSVGGFCLKAENNSDEDSTIIIHVYHSTYPYDVIHGIRTNNDRLNDLFNKSIYACVNCSQNIFLDSPKHCEPLASCSGDYHLESLNIALGCGNYDLAKHTLRGYAFDMVNHKGNNANANYALIFIIWLWNVYMLCGDKDLLSDCLKGAEAAIKLYSSYVGEKGIVDHPRCYTFVDWLVVDGFSLFAPPANLGQTVTNCFFYKALTCMGNIYNELGIINSSKRSFSKAKRLKKSINTFLFDKEKGLYIEGESINVKRPNCTGVPDGNDKIYYRKHSNVLAVAYGLANKRTSKSIVHKIFHELKDLEIQPYFLHYEFEAINQAGLNKKYAMPLLKEFLKHVKSADKGLPEGFYKPEPSYAFDFSHAWACSPYYSFIIASSGMNILEPGMNKLSFDFKNLGLKDIHYQIGTPKGFIDVFYSKEKGAIIKAPDGIEIVK